MVATYRTKQFGDIRTLVPQDWAFALGKGRLFVSCYRVMVSGPEAIPELMTLDVLGSRILLLWGSVPFIKPRSVTFRNWSLSGIELHVDVEEARTEAGAHLVCLTPYDDSGEEATRTRSASAIGFAMLMMGENIAHSLVFEHDVGADGRPTAVVAQFRTPILFPDPNLPASLQQTTTAAGLLSGLDENWQRRIAHALTWLADGMTRQNADGFVAMWVALEILAMRGATDIRRVNERLASQYRLPYEEACRRFRVGHLFGLRSAIVHRGARVDVKAFLTLYLRAVFLDCLAHDLGLESRAAQAVLDGVPIVEELSKVLKSLD